MKTREQIVQEALSWVGTPYHHEAYVKGTDGGVDCAMINIGVFRDFAGVIPADFDPRPYPAQWFMHQDEERYLNWFSKYARQVEHPQIADVALFKFGRTVSHSGIIINEEEMVHALKQAGKVLVEPLRAYMDRFHSFWSIY